MNINKIDAHKISTECSHRHVQSVIEDLIEIIKKQNKLADVVLRLNPNVNEIGSGMLANMQILANQIKQTG